MIKMTVDLFGQSVIADDSRGALAAKTEQLYLFDNTLSPDLARARRAAKDHEDAGGDTLPLTE